MMKRTLSVALVGLLLALASGAQSVYANSGKGREAEKAEKARAGIRKLGVGPDARVEVKLRDNRKLAGYISEIAPDSFTVTSLKTGASEVVAYPDVAQVKGNNLSTRAKVIIIVVAAVVAAIVLYSVRGAFCDGQC